MNAGDERVIFAGHLVAVAVVPPGPETWDELHPDDRAYAAGLTDRRRDEWIAGRRALRRAIALAGGAVEAAIGVDERGAPRVPPGWVGSISHKRTLAVGLAAPDEGWTLGVDLELDEPRRIDIRAKVLTERERAAGPRDGDVLRAFAIKEAVYKAIDPYLRRYVGFLEVEVWPEPDGEVRVAPVVDWGLELEARWYGDGVHWLGAARARPR